MPRKPKPGAKTRAKKGSPILPCGECKTPEGNTPKGRCRPVRVDGSRFGYVDPLCLICYGKHNLREQRAAKRAKADEAEKIAAASRIESPPIEVPAPDSIPYPDRLRADARHLSLVIQGRIAS